MRLARIGRANAKNLQNLHTPNPAHRPPQGEEKFLVTRRCADRTRTPVQVAPTSPIEGRARLFRSSCGLPQRRAACWCDFGWQSGFADVIQNLVHGTRIGDESDDVHGLPASPTAGGTCQAQRFA